MYVPAFDLSNDPAAEPERRQCELRHDWEASLGVLATFAGWQVALLLRLRWRPFARYSY